MKLTVDTYIAPLIAGQGATRVAAVMDRIGKMIRKTASPNAPSKPRCGDGQGKRVGLPVSELLGGRRRDRPPVAWNAGLGRYRP